MYLVSEPGVQLEFMAQGSEPNLDSGHSCKGGCLACEQQQTMVGNVVLEVWAPHPELAPMQQVGHMGLSLDTDLGHT